MGLINYLTNTEVDEAQLDSADLDTYLGKHSSLYSKEGLVGMLDTREIFHEKKLKLQTFKIEVAEDIARVAPVFKQLNALAGRLPGAEVSVMNSKIDTIRARYAAKRQLVLDAMSFADLELISWR
jgi:hypothetical protein